MVATLAGYGLVIAGMNCCFYLAIKRVPFGVAVALEMVGTIAVAIIGSRRPRDLAAAALAAPSVLVLALTHGSTGRSPPPASRSRWAPERAGAGTSCSRPQHARRLPGAQGLALAMTIAAVPVTLIALAGSGADLLSPRVLAIGAAVGLLSTALPGTLDAIALRRLRSVTYALVLSLSPAVAALSGFAIRGQHLSVAQWVGVVLVMVASAAAVTGAEPPDAAAGSAL